MQRLHPPALPLTGGCTCKAVRFAVSAKPLLIFACHCGECQRWSGSAFALSMPVDRDSFSVTRGEPKPWRHTGASGFESAYWFCADCGGRIFVQRSDRPHMVTIRAGTLDDTSWVRPIAHINLRSAQAWERIPNNAECFDTMPKDFSALARLWQGLWQEIGTLAGGATAD
jgi:hypothetical protein